MPGKIRRLLDEIVRQRTATNPLFATTTKTKLILKGLDPGKFNAASPDDPAILARVAAVAAEMGITLR